MHTLEFRDIRLPFDKLHLASRFIDHNRIKNGDKEDNKVTIHSVPYPISKKIIGLMHLDIRQGEDLWVSVFSGDYNKLQELYTTPLICNEPDKVNETTENKKESVIENEDTSLTAVALEDITVKELESDQEKEVPNDEEEVIEEEYEEETSEEDPEVEIDEGIETTDNTYNNQNQKVIKKKKKKH